MKIKDLRKSNRFMKIKKNDLVLIIAGKDKGKKGKVKESFPRLGKIKVEDIALVKKIIRPRRQGEKGQIVEIPRSIDVSNVKLICSHCHEATRVSYVEKDGRKIRVCQKCHQVMD
jgi:large subunit ribosomal protein L24